MSLYGLVDTVSLVVVGRLVDRLLLAADGCLSMVSGSLRVSRVLKAKVAVFYVLSKCLSKLARGTHR